MQNRKRKASDGAADGKVKKGKAAKKAKAKAHGDANKTKKSSTTAARMGGAISAHVRECARVCVLRCH